jgi:GNAT superfamily N-acetyltransferase
MALTTRPVTAEALPDLGVLFGTSKTTSSCYCMWFVVSNKECQAGWSGGNKTAFEEMAGTVPLGLLAYSDGAPVGWIAAGPRSRYARALRSPTLAGSRDGAEDDSVWLVPCFYVRREARRAGVTRALLEAAVELARTHGARAVEGFPLAGEQRRSTSEAYLGVEPVFAACGFSVVDRPSPGRVVMRRELPVRSRRTSGPGTGARSGR